MDLVRSVNYYVDRLVFQYRDKPNARAMTAIMVKQALADGLLGAINDAFCVDTAVGKQLDIIGKYVGVPRNIGDPLALPFFGFWDSTVTDPGLQNVNGFQDSTDSSVNADGLFFQSVQQGSRNTDLGDDAYRFMIKLKIASNHMNASLASIDSLVSLFFPGQLALIDNKDMTMEYVVLGPLPVSVSVLTPYLPRPMGVGLSVSSFTAISSPAILSGINSGLMGGTAVSGYTDTTPAGGSAPYTYSWTKLSDDFYGALTGAVVAGGSHARFFFTVAVEGASDSVWQCSVTDSRGIVTRANTVSVHLQFDGP